MFLGSAVIISAQVLLTSASGHRIEKDTRITAENISLYIPDQKDVERVIGVLRNAGFDVGPVVGISFSITAPAALFRRVFGVELEQAEDGSIVTIMSNGDISRELPAENLPQGIAKSIHVISFSEPATLDSP